jgi:hypothetical protein
LLQLFILISSLRLFFDKRKSPSFYPGIHLPDRDERLLTVLRGTTLFYEVTSYALQDTDYH